MVSQNTTSQNKRVEALVKRSTKHGQAGRSGKSPTYLIWQSMVGRCHRPTDSSYKYYGAKGVIVCERWRKFENFFEDMGAAPEGMHIHRQNDATIYSKETCEWMDESQHIGLHNQQRGWGARLNRAELIDRVVALQKELAVERQRCEQAERERIESNELHNATINTLREQLLSTQAAIKSLKYTLTPRAFHDLKTKAGDLSLLHQRETKARNEGWNEGHEHERKCATEVRKLLVDLLVEVKELMPDWTMKDLKNRIDTALAQCKEKT